MNSPKQAYDRGISIFSPDGRLYQVEYAREAVKQGTPAVGVSTVDGVVLATYSAPRSSLVSGGDVDNLHSIDDHIIAASAGHAADGRRLVELSRQQAQQERLQYDEPITVRALVTAIGDHIQEHTLAGGVRPYGSSLLVGGYDDRPALFELDPSGAVIEWRANAVGGDKEHIVTYLEDEYHSEIDQQDALRLAVEGLEREDVELSSSTITAGVIGKNGYRLVSDTRIESILDDRD